MTDGPMTKFLAERGELIATAEPGTVSARGLADLTDEAVSALAETASSCPRVPFALLALGGYGARRLLPHSDIDLLVISAGGPTDLEPLVRGLLYPLWDAGFSVGHQVRSVADHTRALRDDIQNLTTFLSARPVAGDPALAARARVETFRRIRKLVPSARCEIAARERSGSPYLLEPDLKSGSGGQRDIDELVWYAALERDAPAHDTVGLVGAGLLELAEHEKLAEAQYAITAARWRLHARAGRGCNAMSVEDAEAAGIDAGEVQRALECVHHTLLTVRARMAKAPVEPASPLGLPGLVAAVEHGPDALPELERAAWLGRLENVAPGFAELMSLRRPALSHRYTVGAHCLRTLTLLSRPIAGTTPVPLGNGSGDALVIAGLAHDLGKREPGPGHAARGQADARAMVARMGLPPEVGEAAATLVREHLLLSEVATRSDLSDEDVVLTAAARVGDLTLVRPLYLLTAADMQATGPDVWTPWRAALVGDLAAKMEAALSPDIDGAGIVAAAETTRAEAHRRALAVGASRTVIAFLEHAPLRYLANRTAGEILHDARLVQTLAGPGHIGEIAFSTRAAPAPMTWLLDVVTRDRPGLFGTIAGVLELSGLDVLSAEAYTATGSIALDTFTVTAATLAHVTERTWVTLRANLDAALAGRLDLEIRLAERRRHYTRTDGVTRPVEVTAGGPMTFSTAVHVRAPDRVGLLHDLAHALECAGLDIRRAMVTTTAGVADDVFEVTDTEGAPPAPATLEETLVPLLNEVAGAR
jgi:[protein-PII] uridylyltransferase